MACRPLHPAHPADDVFTLATDILDQHDEPAPIDVGQFMKTFYRGVIPTPPPDPADMN